MTIGMIEKKIMIRSLVISIDSEKVHHHYHFYHFIYHCHDKRKSLIYTSPSSPFTFYLHKNKYFLVSLLHKCCFNLLISWVVKTAEEIFNNDKNNNNNNGNNNNNYCYYYYIYLFILQ